MKKNLLLLYLTTLCLFSFNNYAQKGKASNEAKKSDNYVYINTTKTYERVSDKGYKSAEILKKMGNTYYFNDDFEKAAKCYGELCERTTDLEPEIYYRYSIVLKAIGEKEKASDNLKIFNQLSGNQTK